MATIEPRCHAALALGSSLSVSRFGIGSFHIGTEWLPEERGEAASRAMALVRSLHERVAEVRLS